MGPARHRLRQVFESLYGLGSCHPIIGALGLLQAATRRRMVESYKGYVGLQDLRSFMASPCVAMRSERNRRLWYFSDPSQLDAMEIVNGMWRRRTQTFSNMMCLSFEEAITAFADSLAIDAPDRYMQGRFVLIGNSARAGSIRGV